MNEFKKNLIYMQWRYYIDVFLRRTDIVDIVKNMTGTNLYEAADDYINFMKDNNITEYRKMLFLEPMSTFKMNFIHDIINVTLKSNNEELESIYEGFKIYFDVILGKHEYYKGIEYTLLNPFYSDSIGNEMKDEYLKVLNNKEISVNSYLKRYVKDMCEISIDNVCCISDYYVNDNMSSMCSLISIIAMTVFFRYKEVKFVNS